MSRHQVDPSEGEVDPSEGNVDPSERGSGGELRAEDDEESEGRVEAS